MRYGREDPSTVPNRESVVKCWLLGTEEVGMGMSLGDLVDF